MPHGSTFGRPARTEANAPVMSRRLTSLAPNAMLGTFESGASQAELARRGDDIVQTNGHGRGVLRQN